MDLFHFHIASGNFGDDLNLWLWDEILPGWREAMPGHLLVGVGTLINDKLPHGVPKVVLGAGVGYGNLPDAALKAECRFVAVRGPRSAKALGLPPEVGIVDPAVLIADLPTFQDIPKSALPIFVPHISSLGHYDWPRICKAAGCDFVSPAGEAESVIRRIVGAPLVVAESMHAAIIADAFRVPWHALAVTPDFNYEKWLDWADSLEIRFTENRPIWEKFVGRAQSKYEQRFISDAGPPSAGPAETSLLQQTKRHVRSVLNRTAKPALLALQLRNLQRMKGYMSSAEVLSARKASLREKLADVLRETQHGH